MGQTHVQLPYRSDPRSHRDSSSSSSSSPTPVNKGESSAWTVQMTPANPHRRRRRQQHHSAAGAADTTTVRLPPALRPLSQLSQTDAPKHKSASCLKPQPTLGADSVPGLVPQRHTFAHPPRASNHTSQVCPPFSPNPILQYPRPVQASAHMLPYMPGNDAAPTAGRIVPPTGDLASQKRNRQ